MDHLADSIAKLSQGRENWYISRGGVPVVDSSGGKCEPVIVFERMDLSIGKIVSSKVLRCWDSYNVICDLICDLISKVYCLCGVGLRDASLGPST